MKRIVYLHRLLDARDRWIGASVLTAMLVLAAWGGWAAGYAVGVHELWTAHATKCELLTSEQAKRHGFQIERVALPCAEGRR